MLQAIPKHWFSWDFTVVQGSQALADIDMSAWRERGTLTVEGKSYRVYREGVMSGDFILESPEELVARAAKPSVFRRAFLVEYGGQQYELRAKSVLRRTFVLLDGQREIGSVSRESVLTRRTAVDLPEHLPLPVRIFIVWLVVIVWKRDAAAAGGG